MQPAAISYRLFRAEAFLEHSVFSKHAWASWQTWAGGRGCPTVAVVSYSTALRLQHSLPSDVVATGSREEQHQQKRANCHVHGHGVILPPGPFERSKSLLQQAVHGEVMIKLLHALARIQDVHACSRSFNLDE